MNNRRRRHWPALRARLSALLMAVILCLCGFASISAFPQNKEYQPDIRKTEGGVRYVSTGVGFDSRVNLPRFSLMLVFATKTRAYLASIDTEITPGPAGRPIRIYSTGPWLHVDLAPGKYAIKARTTRGQEVQKTFTIVRGRVTRVNLIWDISDEDI